MLAVAQRPAPDLDLVRTAAAAAAAPMRAAGGVAGASPRRRRRAHQGRGRGRRPLGAGAGHRGRSARLVRACACARDADVAESAPTGKWSGTCFRCLKMCHWVPWRQVRAAWRSKVTRVAAQSATQALRLAVNMPHGAGCHLLAAHRLRIGRARSGVARDLQCAQQRIHLDALQLALALRAARCTFLSPPQ